jgi:hypothetical protein
MSKREAVAAANHAAEAAGYRLADYQHPRGEFFHYPNLKAGGGEIQEWWILYEPRVELRATNAQGITWVTNGLCISVECTTGATKFGNRPPEPD